MSKSTLRPVVNPRLELALNSLYPFRSWMGTYELTKGTIPEQLTREARMLLGIAI